MEKIEIHHRVIEALENFVDREDYVIDSDSYLIDDLGLGSMDVITMVSELEDEVGIIFDEEDLRSFVQVKDIEEYIYKKVGLQE